MRQLRFFGDLKVACDGHTVVEASNEIDNIEQFVLSASNLMALLLVAREDHPDLAVFYSICLTSKTRKELIWRVNNYRKRKQKDFCESFLAGLKFTRELCNKIKE